MTVTSSLVIPDMTVTNSLVIPKVVVSSETEVRRISSLALSLSGQLSDSV